VELRNRGTRPALETVQLYVRDLVTSASWADKELKGFRQVLLQPGESACVEIAVPVDRCTIVNARGERVVEPGAFELLAGPSSRDSELLGVAFTVLE
jgi:beta-glucosidase